MKSSAAPLFAATLFFLLLPGAGARAGFIPWDYSWSRSPIIIPADSHGTGGIAFTYQPAKHTAGNATTVATTLTMFSSAQSFFPDHIYKKGYHLTLWLRDDTSRAAGTLTFSGYLSGSFWASGASIANTFVGPAVQKIHLGHYWYTVAMGPYVSPTDSRVGLLEARVTVEHNPEPSSLALAGLGIASLALVWWRRARVRKVAA
jgi:hypothetical protein